MTIASVPSLMEAELVCGLLRSGEIEAIIPDAEMLRIEPHLAHALTGSSGFEVQVPSEDAEAARELLSLDLSDDPVTIDDGPVKCPRCETALIRMSSPDASRDSVERCLRCGYIRTEPSMVPRILLGFAAITVATLIIYGSGFSTRTIIGVLIIAVAFRLGWQRLASENEDE